MRYCSAQVDALERAALTSTSTAARKRIYGQIQRIVARDLPILYLFNADYIYAYRAQFQGFMPNAFLPTWNAAQWMVLNSH
jgi:ABC-type transport system substrate-binding protein